MDLEKLWEELVSLKKEMQGIREGMAELTREVLTGERGLLRAVNARGMKIHRMNSDDDLLFPPTASPEDKTALYQMLKHYSFRLFVRDVISAKKSFWARDLVRYSSLETVHKYIAFLKKLGIIGEVEVDTFRLLKDSMYSFGPTLEWFVAEMFQREFGSPALYGVRFKDTPSGGDYDVIALWEGWLVYVEIKSSPPRGIERGEIGSFLARISDLLPDLAFLFNDTQLRMKDKIVLMFEEELAERYGTSSSEKFPVQRLADELFQINHRIYVVNSKRDVAVNFSLCLRDFLAHQKHEVFPLISPSID